MRLALALVLALACACNPVRTGDDERPDARAGGGGGSGSAQISVFDPSITNVIVEIDYETGKQPFTGGIVGFGDTFDPTVTNVNRLFAGQKQVTIPKTLAEMEDVGAIDDEELTIDDILALAALHRSVASTETTRAYYVIFVSGHFADSGGTKPGILGISIGDQIAMFKDVIDSTNVVLSPNVVRYVEQSTLIHELSHSIGLVDNGVDMASAHKDAAHGAHCDNPDCVMYWQNDGSQDAARFAQQQLLTGSSILFDAKCLADVDALTGGP